MAEGKEKAKPSGAVWGWWLAGFLGVMAVAAYVIGRNKVPFGTMTLLYGTSLVVLAVATYLSFRIAGRQTEQDNEVHSEIKHRPFLLNPVILTYVAFLLVLFILLAYFGARI